MAPQFTEAVTEALEKGFAFAQEHHHTEVGENHLLFGFLQDPQGYFHTLSTSLNLNPATLLQQLEAALGKVPRFEAACQAPGISLQLQNRIAEAQAIANKWNDSYLSSDHFFYVFWQSAGEPFASWKKSSPLSLSELEKRIKHIRGTTHMDSPTAESSLQALDKYCRNLTSLAKGENSTPLLAETMRSVGPCKC